MGDYVQFLGKLKDSVEEFIKDANLQQMLLKQLAIENANEDCQNVIDQFEKPDLLWIL